MPSLLKEKLGYVDQHSSPEDAINSIVKVLNGSKHQKLQSSSSVGVYAKSPVTGTLGASENKATMTTIVSDPFGSYKDGVYNVGENGYYSIAATLTIGCSTTVAGKVFIVALKLNGTIIAIDNQIAQGALSLMRGLICLNFIYLNKGDQVTVDSFTTTVSPSYAAGYNNYFSIVKTGN